MSEELGECPNNTENTVCLSGKFLCSSVALMEDGSMESVLRNLITAIPNMMNGELA